MLIDNIILNNFRTYRGENHVGLSLNPEKHVTIVSGQNGFGKTSLLTALVWGLYGKLMSEVDERYKKEITESGGYQKYTSKLMNRTAQNDGPAAEQELLNRIQQTPGILDQSRLRRDIDQLFCFSVRINLTNIFIPHIPCNDVAIIRTHNIKTSHEKLEILIDGKVNELTQNIGHEIFINDFILPKEIAKFFFFDAEKITALAEVKNIEEKQYFSKAYNEVLGIKRYTDLKANLEHLKLRISKRSASKGDLKKIESLQQRLAADSELLFLSKEELDQKEQESIVKKTDLAEIQERLVRLGSAMTNAELQDFKKLRTNLIEDLTKNKAQFSELLELAPFAILGSKMALVQEQLQLEKRHQHLDLINDLLNEKKIMLAKGLAGIAELDQEQVKTLLDQTLAPVAAGGGAKLLSFNEAQYDQFAAIYQNLQGAYAKGLKALIADGKRLSSTYNITQKKLKDAETKSNDPIIQKLKNRFDELQRAVDQLADDMLRIKIDNGVLERDISALSRQISEHAKHIKIEKQELVKSQAAERLIVQLEGFIFELKSRKKISLEKNIKKELNGLMHKRDFVEVVVVRIEGDLIDIELYDKDGHSINKDGLSKGEQQLYATALLKALITESNIQFPVFIDSPLQKLDKRHAANILRLFYPNVSSQVVLFPLLEKELSVEEFQILLPKVGKSYLIQQNAYNSYFLDVKPQDLFDLFDQSQEAYV
jgi:DNA sulfur modification protein DndD